jgi:hypothetical protein
MRTHFVLCAARPVKLNAQAAFLALLLGAALPNAHAATIPFPTVAGEWLAQVTAVIAPGDGTNTQYVGYSSNYGPIPLPNTNLGPVIPNNFLPTQGFVDTLHGTLGVTGEAPGGLGPNYFTRAEADFAIAVQFNMAGTVSFAMREQGFVGVNGTSGFDHAEMQTSVAIVDNTVRGASSVGTLLCVSAPVVLCSTPLSVDQVFTATLDVVPGHVYTLSAAEWGDANGYGVFDGLDPVTMSLQLDDGMFIVPVGGTTLPGFLGGPVPGSGSAPEPATWALTGCAAAILTGRRLRQLRRLGASPATQRSVEPGNGV